MHIFSGKSQQQVNISALGAARATIIIGSQESHEVEVAVIEIATEPKEADLRSLWRERSNNGNRKVVVVADHGDRMTLFGPAQDRQSVTLKSGIARRLIQNFLDAPDLLSAVRELVGFYDAHSTSDLGGIKNKGLFASHHLRENLPQRRDWETYRDTGHQLADKRHRGLIEALGFQIAKEERNAMVLRTESPESRVVALVLEDNEPFDAPTSRFPSSPVSLGLSMAAEYNVPWLILVRKDQIRLHPCRDGVGVGQKGQAETYFELNLSLLDDDNVGLLPLVFSAKSLSQGGEVDKLLADSAKFAASLGVRLRERVYEQVVPPISIAVAKKLKEQGQELNTQTLQSAYSMSLKILFRLLFQAYAEDRGLLPAGRNEGFDANSLKELGKRHMDTPVSAFGQSASIWYDLVQVWDAIDVGNEVWQIPAYNGGLFGSDPTLHPEGAAIKQLQLPDSVLGPALQGLLIDATEDGVRGPVDFRALSVREFGTIYEGLLESSLSLADVDLTVDASNAWVPAKGSDPVYAAAGDPYFHSASGERKATGSYFTPKFVVDHLVQKAIDPTIDAHLERIATYLRAGDTATAGREFFDFRVADLAMGSAHFLVAAIDRIEAKMRAFLAQSENTVPAVIEELERLRNAAIKALKGDEIAISEIEDFSLLRRQIARRCIYGLDINYMAVELARLAIWIHTFVPGLPMSTLDHNLVHGNSLTGIGSISEALDALAPKNGTLPTLFEDPIFFGLNSAKGLLIDAAAYSEADKGEIKSARKLAAEATSATRDISLALDAAIAARIGVINPALYYDFAGFVHAGQLPEVLKLTESLRPAHLPHLFPEVFLRENSGFDALIGNPPWEKIKVEKHIWWGLRIPGLRGLPMAQREARMESFKADRPDLVAEYQSEVSSAANMRLAILRGPFPGLGGGGDPDLYQAFVWRNWNAMRKGGAMAIVTPRGLLGAANLAQFRASTLKVGTIDATIASNSRHWLFENVDSRYTISLAVISRDDGNRVLLRGPITTLEQLENPAPPAVVSEQELSTWSDKMNVPLLPDPVSAEIYRLMRNHPTLMSSRSDFEFQPSRDCDASNDRSLFSVNIAERTNDAVDVLTGSSFNIWEPDYGDPYGFAPEGDVRDFIWRKIEPGQRSERSAYFGLSFKRERLPFDQPRLAFRDVTNSTNTRTSIWSLIPPKVICTNKAPVLVRRRGGADAEAYLLGIACSIPYDWQMRKIVELGMSQEILKSSAVPLKRHDVLSERLVKLSGSLAAADARFTDWAEEAGVAIGTVKTEEQKNSHVCEIDALVSLMYGLSEEHVAHIFETFHRGWDYKPRLSQVLDFYRHWKGKVDA